MGAYTLPLCRTDIERSLPPPLLSVTACGRTTCLFQCDGGRLWEINSSRMCHDSKSSAISHRDVVKPPAQRHTIQPPPPPSDAPYPPSPASSSPNRTRPTKSRIPRKKARKNIMDAEARRRDIEADEWASEVTPTSVRCRGCQKIIRLDRRSLYYRGLWDKHRDICRAIRRLKCGLAAKPVERVGAQKNGRGTLDIQEQGLRRTTGDGIMVSTKPEFPALPTHERRSYPFSLHTSLSGPGIPPPYHCEYSYTPTAISRFHFPCDHDSSVTPLSHQVSGSSVQDVVKREDIGLDMYECRPVSCKPSTTEFDLLQAAQCLISLKSRR